MGVWVGGQPAGCMDDILKPAVSVPSTGMLLQHSVRGVGAKDCRAPTAGGVIGVPVEAVVSLSRAQRTTVRSQCWRQLFPK